MSTCLEACVRICLQNLYPVVLLFSTSTLTCEGWFVRPCLDSFLFSTVPKISTTKYSNLWKAKGTSLRRIISSRRLLLLTWKTSHILDVARALVGQVDRLTDAVGPDTRVYVTTLPDAHVRLKHFILRKASSTEIPAAYRQD